MKEKPSKCMSFKHKVFLFFLLVFSSLQAFAQSEISGIIKDEKGETVIGATVKVKGTGIGTITDYNGAYTLTGVPADAKVLEVSYVGMQTQDVPISGSKADVVLKEVAKELTDFVVTGYGVTNKRDLVNAVSSVSAEQIKNIPVSSAAEAMQGKLAGVNITTTDGSPDANISVRVRGGSSLTQNSDPLYIVDGFPVSNINDIPPSDIKSIDVLKDASATAIYGAQGANGVIIITTKDADDDDSNSKSKFNFNVDYTGYIGYKKMVNPYEMMNAEDFIRMQYEYAYLSDHAKNTTIPTLGKDKILDNFYKVFDYNCYLDTNGVYTGVFEEDNYNKELLPGVLNYWETQPTTDWQDETFGFNGMNLNNSLSVKGGNKKVNFTMSYNRIDDKGIMYESEYTRDNVSLKTNIKPIKNLTVSLKGRYANTRVLGAGANTADDAGSKTESRVRNAVAYTPIKLLKVDTDLIDDADNYGSMYDPISTIDDNYKFKTDEKWTANATIKYKFLKAFTLSSAWGYEYRTTSTDRCYGNTAYYSREGDGKTGAGGVTGYASTIIKGATSSNLQNTNTLTYTNNFKGGHNLTAILGEETNVNNEETFTETTFGYPGNTTGEDVLAGMYSYLGQFTTNYSSPNDNMLSFFAKADYNYKSRYYLNGTFRADASTRFANNDSIHNQWGYFPSVSVAWRMLDEPWLKDALLAAKVSNLKWRFSYGVAGNNNVDLGYLYNSYIEKLKQTASIGTYVDLDPYDLDIKPNPRLKWETTITRDLGLDFGFFKDRLSGTVDGYINSTKDLIILRILGSSKQYQNVGETQNKGVEVSLTGVILNKKSKQLNYGLSVDANVSFNKSEVISLGGAETYNVATGYLGTGYANADVEYQLKVGDELGRVWGYEYEGYYTTADFNAYDPITDKWLVKDANGTLTYGGEKYSVVSTIVAESQYGARPGTMKYKDQDGNGVIDGNDRTVIGNTMPDYTGGFSINGNIGGNNWGTIDVSANFNYSVGNDVVNLTALDLTTIHSKSKLRNNLNTVAYGSRYSLFAADGSYLPANGGTDLSGLTVNDNYTTLATTIEEYNTNATIYNPVVYQSALSSKEVEDGSFLRFSALTVGYSLPDKWIRKAYITKLRVFFSASNLFCWTNYSGNDPEVNTGAARNPLAVGLDFSAYPKSRAFNFGLNLSF